MKYHEDCGECGNRKTAYTHQLNKALASAFVKMVTKYLETGKPVNVNTDLGLSHNQLANWQKLRHYEIVEAVEEGGWIPTPVGLGFYKGEIAIQVPAGSLANKTLADSHPAWKTHKKMRVLKFISEIVEVPYKRRDDFKEEKTGQASFL